MTRRLPSLAAALIALLGPVACSSDEPEPETSTSAAATTPTTTVSTPNVCDLVAAPDGSDDARGTASQPLESAGVLVDALTPGDTGCFRAGEYEFDQLELETPGIALIPYRGEEVTLAGDISIVPQAEAALIQGLTLDSTQGENGTGPKIYASNVVLRDNEITNSHTGTCILVGPYFDRTPPEGILIEGNRIHGCGQLPRTNLEHGIYISSSTGTIVRDNWIYNNADRGVQQYPAAIGAEVTGNVIAGNADGVNFSGDGGEVTTDSTVEGNVIVDPRDGLNAYSGGGGPDGTGNVFRDNCVYTDSGESGIEADPRSFEVEDNLVANPRFVDPEAGDYRMRPASECLAKYTGELSLPDAPPAR